MARLLTMLLAVVVLSSSCGGGGEVSQPSDPAGVSAEAGPSTTASVERDVAASVQADDEIRSDSPGDVVSDGVDSVADTDEPDLATEATITGAAATFSEDHLDLGTGSQFPSVDESIYVPAAEASWLEPTDVVLGVVKGDTAVAFPVMQMQFHHIANIEVAGEPYLVTY